MKAVLVIAELGEEEFLLSQHASLKKGVSQGDLDLQPYRKGEVGDDPSVYHPRWKAETVKRNGIHEKAIKEDAGWEKEKKLSA